MTGFCFRLTEIKRQHCGKPRSLAAIKTLNIYTMTKFHLRLFIALVMTLTFQSCISTKIESNKSPDFNQKISKIYITVKGSSQKYMKQLTGYILSGLKSHGVEAVVYYYDPLSLDTEKDILEKIKAYNPDLVMSIGQTEKRATSNYYYGTNTTVTGATLDIKLFIPDKENPVWRASLKTDSDLGVVNASESSAKKIISKMKDDGIIN